MIRFYFLSIFLLVGVAQAQQTTLQNGLYGGFPFLQNHQKLFKTADSEVWVGSKGYAWPSRLTATSGTTYLPAKLGVEPQGNPIIGVWKSANGSTWLANGWLPGEPSFSQPPTGGLLRATRLDTGGNFQLFNSLINVPLQQVREPRWYTAVPVGNGNQVWLSSDSGLRRIDVNNLASAFIRKENLPIQGNLQEGKNLVNRAFLKNSAHQWLYLDNLNPVFFNPATYLALPVQTKVFDLEIFGTDTLFTADSSGNANFRLFRRTNRQTTRLLPTDSLGLVRKESGGAIWFSGQKRGLFRLKNNQVLAMPEIANLQVNDLLIDSLNLKLVLANNNTLFLINDIIARIHFPDTAIDLCRPGPVQFTDSSTTIGDGIARWLWDFGDGNTSTEQNPRHRYQRGGLYYVSLTLSDQNGSQNMARDTVMVFDDEYHKLNNERDISTCQPLRLDFYSITGTRWTLPNGTVADTQFVQATQSGLYRVQTVGGRCQFKDSVLVTFRGESTTGINLFEENGEAVQEVVSGFPPITLMATTPTEFCAYTWYVNGDSLGVAKNQPIILNEPGKYSIRLDACDFTGCKYIGERIVNFENGKIPNVVTANGDGLNDFFEISSTQTKKLSIHNRWGKAVFNTDNYQNNWPGQDTKPGTYFYRLDMGSKVYSGWVEVLGE